MHTQKKTNAMKKMLLIVCCILPYLFSQAQLPPFQWVRELEGTDGKAITIDPAGNVYCLGYFTGNPDFDPGPGTVILDGSTGSAYIAKYTNEGNFIWATQLPTTALPEDIAVDAAQNVYVTGEFILTQDFDPGPGVLNLTSLGQNDSYIVKLNAGGNFLWAKSLGGTQSQIGYDIAVSQSGMVYTVGSFTGLTDFDPGPGAFNLTSGLLFDSYISALDADGNFAWVQRISGGTNQAHSITTNALGNIVIAGQFNGTKDFDPGAPVFNLTSAGGPDIYILKLDAAGGFISAVSFGGPGIEANESVALDASGNIYVSGNFQVTTDLDPGLGVLNFTATGASDIFVLKLTPTGSLVWAKQMGGPTAETALDIITDAVGDVYTTGLYQNTVDFDPGAATYNLTSFIGDNDIFISKLNTNGNFVWAVSFSGESSADRGKGIAIDPAGFVYTTGNFLGTVDFDPGPAVVSLVDNLTSVFVLKLGIGASAALPLSLVNFSGSATANGNLLTWQTATETNTQSFEIEWSSDGLHFTQQAVMHAAGNSVHNRRYGYTHRQPANGTNYYRLKMTDMDGKFTYSPIVVVKDNNALMAIKVFPNPVSDRLQVDINAAANETLVCHLQDAAGIAVAEKSFTLVKGSNRLYWQLPPFAAGNYFISFSNPVYETIQIMRY
jgi:hypothetical protein